MAKIVGGNQGSVDLHARAGFLHAGHEREVGRKFDRWLELITMQLILDCR